MDAGAPAERISFGNTIKKERDIARAYRARRPPVRRRLRRGGREDRPRRSRRPRVLPRPDRRRGRRMAAVAQVRLRAGDGRRRAAPRQGARPRRLWRVVPCRLAADRPVGLGPRAGRRQAGLRDARRRGHRAEDGQYGRRLPDALPASDVPAAQAYGQAIFSALRKHFGNAIPETIIEPGRGMVGNAGVIKSEVVLVSKKADNDNVRWVYPRHRQVRRARRDDGRGDPLPDRDARTTATRPRLACSPARPAIRPT